MERSDSSQSEEKYEKSGLVTVLHGITYQTTLLLFCICSCREYKAFKMQSENCKAWQYDDIIIKYNKGGEPCCQFFQVKSKKNQLFKIDFDSLTGEHSKPFSLYKYYSSFRKIQDEPDFATRQADHFTICTSAKFDEFFLKNRGINLKEYDTEDPILKSLSKINNNKVYKLSVDQSHQGMDLFLKSLKFNVCLNKPMRDLLDELDGKKRLSNCSKLDVAYYKALVREVLKYEVETTFITFREQFLNNHNLSREAITIRKSFITYFRLTDEEFKDMCTIKRLEFISPFLQIYKIFDKDIEITKDVVNDFFRIFENNFKNKAMKIKIECLKILNALDKLLENEIISKKIKLFKFSSESCNTHSISQTINYFIDKMKAFLQKNNITDFEFEISNYPTFEKNVFTYSEQGIENENKHLSDFFEKAIWVTEVCEENVNKDIYSKLSLISSGVDMGSILLGNIYMCHLKNFILEWIKSEDGTALCPKKIDKEIHYLKLFHDGNESKVNHIMNGGIDIHLKDIDKFLKLLEINGNQKLTHLYFPDIEFGIKLLFYLLERKYGNLRTYFFFKSSYFIDHKESVLEAYRNRDSVQLVAIYCDTDDVSWINLTMQAVLKLNTNKPFIIMSKQLLQPDSLKDIDEKVIRFEKCTLSLMDFEEKIQIEILKRQFHFQGKFFLDIKQLLFGNKEITEVMSILKSKEVLNFEILMTLLDKNIISIGKNIQEPKSRSQSSRIYINRTLRSQFVSIEKLNNISNCTFVLVCNNKESIQPIFPANETIFFDKNDEKTLRIVRFCVVKTVLDADDFFRKFKNITNRDAHRLKAIQDPYNKTLQIIYDMSYKGNLEKHLEYSQDTILEETKSKIIAVTSNPGMGKSMLLNRISQEFKEKHQDYWVFILRVNDLTNRLEKVKEMVNSPSEAIDFLISDVLIPLEMIRHNATDQNLVRFACLLRGNMLLVLDGLDDFNSVNLGLSHILHWIRFLAQTPIKNIILSCRSNMKENVKCLEPCFFSLTYFSNDNKSHFLKKSLENRINLDYHEPDIEITFFNEWLNNDRDSENKDLLGTPQHIEAFAKAFRKYRETRNCPLIRENHYFKKYIMFYFFDILLEEKFCIFHKEKVLRNEIYLKKHYVELQKICIYQNQISALCVVLEKQFDELNLPNYAGEINELKENIEQLGLVTFKNDIPEFIDKSIALFLVALYFSDWIKCKKIKFIHKDILQNEKFKVLRNFINTILTITNKNVIKDSKMLISTVLFGTAHNSINTNNKISKYFFKENNPMLKTSLKKAFIEKNYCLCDFFLREMTVMKRKKILTELLMANSANENVIERLVKNNNLELLIFISKYDSYGSLYDLSMLILYAIKYDKIDILGWIFKSTNKGGLGANIREMIYDKNNIINLRDSHKESKQVIHYAITNGDTMKWVIKPLRNGGAGADINALDSNGQSPLHYAILNNQLKTVELLCEKFIESERQAEIHVIDNEGFSPLHHAVKSNNLAITKLLCKSTKEGGAGADVNVRDRYGRRPIHFTAKLDTIDILEWLSKPATEGGGGSDVFARDNEELTPLHLAILEKNIVSVEWMCKSRKRNGGGVDINVEDNDGKRPIHYAAMLDDESMLELMVTLHKNVRGEANLTVEDKDGYTPLYHAILKGRLKTVKWFCKSKTLGGGGVDPQLKNSRGKTALDIAQNCEMTKDRIALQINHKGVLKYLKELLATTK